MVKVERIDAIGTEVSHFLQRTTAEGGIVLHRRSVPADFSQSEHTRIEHGLGMSGSRHIFRPEIALNALHMGGALRGRKIVAGDKAIDFLQCGETADGFGLTVGGILVEIQVAVGARTEDDIVAIADCIGSKVGAAPYHDGGVL